MKKSRKILISANFVGQNVSDPIVFGGSKWWVHYPIGKLHFELVINWLLCSACKVLTILRLTWWHNNCYWVERRRNLLINWIVFFRFKLRQATIWCCIPGICYWNRFVETQRWSRIDRSTAYRWRFRLRKQCWDRHELWSIDRTCEYHNFHDWIDSRCWCCIGSFLQRTSHDQLSIWEGTIEPKIPRWTCTETVSKRRRTMHRL